MAGVLKCAAEYKASYQEKELLGEGGFGKVYRVQDLSSETEYAAKHISTTRMKARDGALVEIELLRGLDSPFIIRFVDAFEVDKSIIVVTELLAGGELFERCIDEEVELTEQDCCNFMRQVCGGLAYLHTNSVVHLDLKPENIVITEMGGKTVKIIDFGTALSLKQGEKVQAMVGTAEFVAPEVVNYDDITTGTDQWSLGVLCFILLSGASPFLDEDEDQQRTLSNISMAKYDFDYEEFDSVSAEAKDFISRLLRKSGQQRMTAERCLAHPWLQEEIPRSNVIRVENLRNFLARRRVQAVGRVLRAINVMRKASLATARMRLKDTSSSSGEEDEVGQNRTH